MNAAALQELGNERHLPDQAGRHPDQIIELTMPDSSMKVSFLRQAFVQANPAAFRSSNPNRLIAGTDIRLPNAADILALIFVSPPQTIGEVTRNWISYP